MCALSGRSREELLGKLDYDFFPSEQVAVFLEKDEKVFETLMRPRRRLTRDGWKTTYCNPVALEYGYGQ
jgi:hypothetical protein